eukprot:gene31042-7133_t
MGVNMGVGKKSFSSPVSAAAKQHREAAETPSLVAKEVADVAEQVADTPGARAYIVAATPEPPARAEAKGEGQEAQDLVAEGVAYVAEQVADTPTAGAYIVASALESAGAEVKGEGQEGAEAGQKDEKRYFAFPTLDQLTAATEEELRASGVGPKVAACVCLFSLDKHEAIPVDTHVWQIATRDYLPQLAGKSLTPRLHGVIQDAFTEHFGPFAGCHRDQLPESLRPPPSPKTKKKATKSNKGVNTPPDNVKTPTKSGKTTEKSVKTTKKSVKATEKSVKTPTKTVKTTDESMKTTDESMKTTEKSVKATEKSVKTPAKSVKTTERSVKTPPNGVKKRKQLLSKSAVDDGRMQLKDSSTSEAGIVTPAQTSSKRRAK